MDDMVKRNKEIATKTLNLQKGDKIIITTGLSNKREEKVTNMMKIEEI